VKDEIKAFNRGPTHLTPALVLGVWMILWLGLPRPAWPILFYSTADPTHNTNAPTGSLTNSGWQYQGTWGVYLGTPVAPKYFITAAHVGGAVGDRFRFRGVDYTTTGVFDDPSSDLRLWSVCGVFPDYAPLYSLNDEITRPVVIFGRGTQRGSPVTIPSGLSTSLKGWLWGPSDSVQRWGTNVVTTILNGDTLAPLGAVIDGPTGDLLKCSFDSSGGGDEANLSVGDSAGGVFIQDGAVWKLAGINYGVDGPYNTNNSGGGFVGAIFDEGGLYKNTAGNWTLTPDLPVDLPGGFYATRVSVHLDWINSVLQSAATPESPPKLFSASNVLGPYQEAQNAVVNVEARTVRLPAPPDHQFYRLQACSAYRITGLSTQGSTLVIRY